MLGVTHGMSVGSQRRLKDSLEPRTVSAKPNGAKTQQKLSPIQSLSTKAHHNASHVPSYEEKVLQNTENLGKSTVDLRQPSAQPSIVERNTGKPATQSHTKDGVNMINNGPIIFTQEPAPGLVSVPRFTAFGWDAEPTRAVINEVCRRFRTGRCPYGRQCHRIHPRQNPTSTTHASIALEPDVKLPAKQPSTVEDDKPHTKIESTMSSPPSDRSHEHSQVARQITLNLHDPVLRYHPERGIIPLNENLTPETVRTKDEPIFINDNCSPVNLSSASSSSSSVAGDEATRQEVLHPPPPFTELCRHWLMKKCDKGYDCPYVHGSLDYDRTVHARYPYPSSRDVCKNWTRNLCWRGYLCRYMHGDLDYDKPVMIHSYKRPSESVPSNGYQRDSARDKIGTETGAGKLYPSTLAYHRNDWPRSDVIPVSDHTPPVGQRPLPKFSFLCQEWVKKRCRRGYSCDYIHSDLVYDQPPQLVAAAPVPRPTLEPVSALTVAAFDDPPVGKRPPPKYSETCIRWLRGRCELRYACIRRHNDLEYDPPVIPQPAAVDKAQPPAEPRTWTVKVHDHAKVTLGPGLQVQEMETGFETRWLYLDNIPAATTAEAVLQLLEPFGEVLDVKIPSHVNNAHMLVRARFSSAAAARQASTSLHGADALGGKITARLPMHEASGLNATLQDTAVRIRWEAPGKLAYCGYSSIQHAYEGIAAAQKLFRDRYLHASEHTGLPAVGIVTICFRGLPPDVTKEDMAHFGKPDDVVWSRPNYQNLRYAADRIKRILQEDAELLHFEVQPPPYRDGGTAQAWAYFPTPRDAKAVCGRLNGRKPMFTGKTRIFAQHVQTLSLSVPTHVYQRLAGDIQALCTKVFRERKGTMYVIQRPAPLPTSIKVSGDDLKEIGQLKGEIEKVLNWETLRQGANVAWDPFFAYPVGRSFIEALERDYPSVSIRVYTSRRSIYLSGSSQSRSVVRDKILGKMAELSSQQVHTITLQGRLLGVFFRKVLAELENQFGRENVSLDPLTRRLSIRGSDDAYQTAREAVRRAAQECIPTDSRVVTACPVCFDEVTNPVRLFCGHSWCRDCLSRYLVSSTNNKNFPLTCLGNEGKCTDYIPLVVARKVLTIPEFDAVVEAAFVAHVQSHPKEFHYCPTPDCPQVYRHAPRDTVLQCPSCLLRICPSCHVEAHDGFACPDPEADNLLFREWTKGHDVKHCPGCKILIERAEGCNHMTCTQCKTHICWVCSQTFPGGDGIYDHMRAAHGGIGLLED